MELGKIECPKCKGKGTSIKFDGPSIITIVCQFCKGNKIIDWIEQVVGVNNFTLPPKKKFSTYYENRYENN